jgi:hypothetical protein
MDDVDYVALWAQIDALLLAKAPRVFRGLRAPLKDAGLAWLRSQAKQGGVRLHPAVEATYRAHDGAKGERRSLIALVPFGEQGAWANMCNWHSSWIAREELAVWRDALGTDEEEGGWPARWLPIGRDGGGNAVVLSLGSGELFAWDHEGSEPIYGPTLGAFLVTLARDLVEDRVGEDEDGEPTRDLVAAPASAAQRAADPVASFVQLLVERKFAELSLTDELSSALRTALSRKTARARKKAVIDVLHAHPDVADVYADDEVLEVLVDEFG